MTLEANIFEQLQELRKWQQLQQEELTRRQEDQRQKLSSEQSHLFEVLSSSFDEMSLDEQALKELLSDQKKREAEANLIRFDDEDEDERGTPQESRDYSQQVDSSRENNEDSITDTPKGQLAARSGNNYLKPNDSSYNNHSYCHDNTSTDLLTDDTQSFCSQKSHRSILIDDMPVPSPKKDFSTLLEEKLKDSEAVKIENTTKPVVKRPFLKKGEGLARFQPNPNKNKKTPRSRPVARSASFCSATQSSVSKQSKPTNLGRCNSMPKTRQSVSKKTVSPASIKKTVSPVKTLAKKALPSVPPVAQTKLSLKNVSAPQRRIINRSTTPTLQARKVVLDKKKAVQVATPDVSNSDLEVKTRKELEEVRIFELLEDKAENSSFCSTSSTVIAFLQQSSTPLKHKALMHSATKHQISLNNVGDQTLEDIVRNSESNNLLVPKAQVNDENQNISQWELISKKQNSKIDEGVVLPYGTDIDMHYDHNYNQKSNQDQNSVSLHVRFAEYNEYKTMSDTSSVTSEMEQSHNFKDQGVWSDNSETPDTSDVESLPQQVMKALSQYKSNPAIPKICVTKESGDSSEYEEEEIQNNYKQTNGKESGNGTEDEGDYEDDTVSKNDTITSGETVIEKDDKSLFKSELLRKRLLELEHEIEVFRKESAALSVQKQKLQSERMDLHEERISMQRSLKEKEASLEIEKKKTESILQEEKKRLAREKAALESRMRDAYEKSQKSKQERQEIQMLREQLDELREELEQKESKWAATNARQRSQMRVLQAENAKLKQEIEQLQQKQKARLKRAVNPNTRAIHQINRALAERKKISPLKSEGSTNREDEPKRAAIDSKYLEVDLETAEEEQPAPEIRAPKLPKSVESIARTRNLYEHLLKDATEDMRETQIGGRHLHDETVQINETEDDEEEEDENNQEVEGNQYCEEVPADYEENEACAINVESRPRKSIENKQDVIKEICHKDGRIEYWYPNGNIKKFFPDTGLTKIIYYNGDVRQTDKDGVVKYYYAETKTWQTTLPDGFEIWEFPDGQVERKSKDGTVEVTYPDGSVKIVQVDGTEKWALRDGTIAETTADGDKVLTLPNGQREIHTKDHKRREYPNGTVKLVYADGTQETRYSNGRVRLKDKDGNLLMDTHQ